MNPHRTTACVVCVVGYGVCSVMVGLMDVVSLVGIVSVFTCGGCGRSI